jgi:hypothetical protein
VALGSCVAFGGFPIAGLKSIDATPLKFDRIDFDSAIGARCAEIGDQHRPGWIMDACSRRPR